MQCTAKSKQSGQQCKRYASPGQSTCVIHGAKAPQSVAAAARRIRESEARADAARFAARTDIHPAEALLELVHYQAGIVDYWRVRVEDVTAEDLEWGTTQHREGSGPEGPIDVTTKEAVPHVAYKLLVEAQDRLAAYAAAALKAGVEERKVRLAESQGAAIAGAIRAILEQLHLTAEQRELVPTVVPAQLRLLAGGAS